MAKRVLLVDDDASNRIVLEKMLQKAGFEPVVAIGIEEAKSLLATQNKIEIAVLDLHLPTDSGYELVDYIRRPDPDNHYQKMPIYACTVDASLETKEKVKASKFDGLLIKPLRLSQINEVLPGKDIPG